MTPKMGPLIAVLLCTSQLATGVSLCPPAPSQSASGHPPSIEKTATMHHGANVSTRADHPQHASPADTTHPQESTGERSTLDLASTSDLVPVCPCGCSEPSRAQTATRANGDALLTNPTPNRERDRAPRTPPAPAGEPSPPLHSIDHVPVLFA